jgi:hypothetical protein
MSDPDFQYKWVSCDGGPLLLVQEKYLPLWEGSDAPSNGRVVQANFRWGLDVATDYDRACDIGDWLGLISVGEGQALVLGGDENATTWLPLEGRQDGMLVRWGYANSEEDAISAAKSLSDKTDKDETLEFSVEESDLILFAACEAGNDKEIYPRLKISLSSGTYKIFTIEYEVGQTSVICHHFRKIV